MSIHFNSLSPVVVAYPAGAAPSVASSDNKSPLGGLNFFKNLNSDKKQTKGAVHPTVLHHTSC